MTATHHCEICEQKTTHVGGKVEVEGERIDAMRCVVCGNIVPIVIHDKPKDEP